MIGHHAFRGMQALALGLAVTAGSVAAAQAQTKIKLVLNWKYEGPQGMFFLAQDRGYFKQEGLDVTFDQGNGSGAAVPQVANGAYDMGFGDINALVELAAKKPDEAPIGVFMLYNRPPFAVAVKADSPIKTPADFVGRKLGGAANDGALKLFPALCAATKIDCSKVEIVNMQPNLREQMLMQGQVDGVFGYITTIRFSAKLTGVDPDKQLRFIKFEDYGMDQRRDRRSPGRNRRRRHARTAGQTSHRTGAAGRDAGRRDEPSRNRKNRSLAMSATIE